MPATTEGDPLYEAIEVFLKGPEVDLADHGLSPYIDKDGHARHRARVAWWRKDAKTLHDLAVMDGNLKPKTVNAIRSFPTSNSLCGAIVLLPRRRSALRRTLLAHVPA